jgi:hypothetical protein
LGLALGFVRLGAFGQQQLEADEFIEFFPLDQQQLLRRNRLALRRGHRLNVEDLRIQLAAFDLHALGFGDDGIPDEVGDLAGGGGSPRGGGGTGCRGDQRGRDRNG